MNSALGWPLGAALVTATMRWPMDAAARAASAAAWSCPTRGWSHVGSRRATATRPQLVWRQVPWCATTLWAPRRLVGVTMLRTVFPQRSTAPPTGHHIESALATATRLRLASDAAWLRAAAPTSESPCVLLLCPASLSAASLPWTQYRCHVAAAAKVCDLT